MGRSAFISLMLAALAAGWASSALAAGDELQFGVPPGGPLDEIAPSARDAIWRDIEAARARLPLAKAGTPPAFQWPLRAARGYADPHFEYIAEYVDHDTATPDHLRDYNCGTRTYDLASGYNHTGTDIGLWPDYWNLMAAQKIEIVAAAPGTILFKADGNFDRNCQFGNGDWNAVYVQHDDGSVAWYGHMKSGTLTHKSVGDRVVAGEFLGNVGSSGNSKGPHLHFEVYDAGNKLIDPFAGQCNNFNSQSWWASQPAYFVTHLNSAMTASAEPVLSTCGDNGQLKDPGSFHAKSAFAPGEAIYFVATARDIQAGQKVNFTVTRPDGSVWLHPSATATAQYPASYWYYTISLESSAQAGTWLFDAELAGTHAQASFDVTPTGTPRPSYTDLWWVAAETGWGINLLHQGDTLFATWFTYDTDHGGLWLVMDDARLQPDGTYAGSIYRTTGVSLAQINGNPAQTGANSVGNGSFRFTSAGQATFKYTVNGTSQQKTLTRYSYDIPPTCAFSSATSAFATNYQDLWWNPSESGWGVNLSHEGDILFATWFTYGSGGRGQWLVASDARRQPTGEFTGRLYRTTGVPLAQISGAPAASAYTDVGALTVTFADGQNGRMDYTVDGVAQSKPISRYVFSAPQTLCR